MIIQTDDMTMEVFENEFKSLGGGAGIQSAGFVHSKGVTTVLTGNCGPNAMDVFSKCQITVVTGQSGAIKDVVQKFKNGELTVTDASTATGNTDSTGTSTCPQNNSSQSRGQGIGCGGGRGMGGGGGRCMGGGRGVGGGGGQGMGGGGCRRR